MQLSHTEKLNKKDTFYLVTKLKKQGKLEEREIDYILNFFAPATPAKCKTAFQWCALAAAGKNEVRYYLKYVHVKNGKAVASMGCFLHEIETDLPNGFYDPKTGLLYTDMNDSKYPDFSKALEGDKYNASNDLIKVVTDSGVHCYKFTLETGEDIYYNQEYVDKSHIAKNSRLTLVDNGTRLILTGFNEFGKWLVMPVDIGKNS